jgi:phosphoribosyl-AMP cyclohydrolase
MAIIKRAAKRIAPKTLEKMKERSKERNKTQEEIGRKKLEYLKKEQEKLNREFDIKQKRIETLRKINEEGVRNQKKRENIFNKLKNKIKDKIFYTEKDWSTKVRSATQEKIEELNNIINKLEQEEKKIFKSLEVIDTPSYRRLLVENLKKRHNELNSKIIERNKMQFFYSFKRQDRWMSGRNLGNFRETHEIAVRTLMKRYETNRLSGTDLKNSMQAIEASVKEVIRQNRQLLKLKSTENIDVHSRIAEKALLKFIKKLDSRKLNETLATLDATINEPGNTVKLLWLDEHT